MHGGIWTLCINLRDDEIRELAKKGFPAYPQCFNYLAGNIDNSRAGGGDEPRADWQHSESQSQIRPHLSRYNRNVLASINPKTSTSLLGFFFLSFLYLSMCTDVPETFLIFNNFWTRKAFAYFFQHRVTRSLFGTTAVTPTSFMPLGPLIFFLFSSLQVRTLKWKIIFPRKTHKKLFSGFLFLISSF